MKKKYISEKQEWLNLTPVQRIIESGKLWELYRSLGGNLDPDPDPQSPFYLLYKEDYRKEKKTRNTGIHLEKNLKY